MIIILILLIISILIIEFSFKADNLLKVTFEINEGLHDKRLYDHPHPYWKISSDQYGNSTIIAYCENIKQIYESWNFPHIINIESKKFYDFSKYQRYIWHKIDKRFLYENKL